MEQAPSVLPASGQSEEGCPACSFTGWIETGSGVKQCECLKQKILKRKLDCIPRRHRGLSFAEMAPMPDKHPSQAKAIPELKRVLKENPRENLFLYGESGAGKSAILFALYQDAVAEGERPAFAHTLDEVLDSYNRYELTRDKTSPVTPKIDPEYLEECATKNICCFVGLDEISFEKPTEYKLEVFFKIVKACHDGNHQLIVTSNFDEAGLTSLWDVGQLTPRPLIRRLIDESTVVHFPLIGTQEYESIVAMGKRAGSK